MKYLMFFKIYEDAEDRIDRFLIQFSSKFVHTYCNYKEVILRKEICYFLGPYFYN